MRNVIQTKITGLAKYLLAVLCIASASCASQTGVNQTNASDPAIASGFSDRGTTGNAAPDEVVKALFKLHNADKSPLYKAKDRTEMEKYFSKDFVNLIWVGGNEPNLINKLAIEGDVLTGLDGSSNFESHDVGKPRIDGDSATVPVTITASYEDKKKFQESVNYELIKESAGWRISDIKHDGNSVVALINNLKKLADEGANDEELTDVKPPFVGTRWFATDPSANGTGTPRYYLKINENNYAFCGYVQTNQADGTDTKEEVPLGKFKKIFNCDFKEFPTPKYKVEGNYIYQLDKNGQVARSENCCRAGDDPETCECKGEFVKIN